MCIRDSYYTVGQRKGLNIGGFRDPLFVLQTDVSNNIIYVGMGESHPALFKKALFVCSNEIHWIKLNSEYDTDSPYNLGLCIDLKRDYTYFLINQFRQLLPVNL